MKPNSIFEQQVWCLDLTVTNKRTHPRKLSIKNTIRHRDVATCLIFINIMAFVNDDENKQMNSA